MLALTVLLSVLLAFLGRRTPSERRRLRLARLLSLVLSGTVIGWTLLRLRLGVFDHRTDLPFDICNMLALAAPLYAWRPRQRVFEIVHLWVLAGTLQAVLTPHLEEGFPHFTFFKYWIVHGGLIVFVIYLAVAFQLFPTLRSVGRAFLWLQGYGLFVLAGNLLLGANYVYLLGKPPTASALDYLGPWPYYLLVVEGVALLLFLLIYRVTASLRRWLNFS